MYLVPVIDWFSRYILSWKLFSALDIAFCLDALYAALLCGKPDIFNTDQGVQFTVNAFTGTFEEAGIRISMDGRGRAFDNIFIERFWRSLKYEDIHINDYDTVLALDNGLHIYFPHYNTERSHQSLHDQTPAEIHFSC